MERILTNQQTFVVFTTDAIHHRWWTRFLKKPFCHCLIMYAWEEDGKHMMWIRDPVVDFSKWEVSFRESEPFQVLHWWSYFKYYRDICMKRNNGIAPKIVKTKVFLDKYKTFRLINKKIPLCTALVKLTIGIPDIFSMTPKQLYKTLSKYGCQDMFVFY